MRSVINNNVWEAKIFQFESFLDVCRRKIARSLENSQTRAMLWTFQDLRYYQNEIVPAMKSCVWNCTEFLFNIEKELKLANLWAELEILSLWSDAVNGSCMHRNYPKLYNLILGVFFDFRPLSAPFFPLSFPLLRFFSSIFFFFLSNDEIG